MKFAIGSLVGVTSFILGVVTMSACLILAVHDNENGEKVIELLRSV